MKDTHIEIPASPIQEMFWFNWIKAPQSSAYNISTMWECQGDICIEALQKAIDHLTFRHEVLRSNFHISNNKLVMRVKPRRNIVLLTSKLSDTAKRTKEKSEQRKELIADTCFKPMNLQTDQLARFALIELDTDHYELYFCIHHIIADGLCFDILQYELAECYNAILKNQQPQLSSPPLLSEYMLNANNNLPLDKDQAKQFWKNSTEHHELSLDFPCIQTDSEARSLVHYFSLPEDLYARINEFKKRYQFTYFEVIAAAWSMVVMRYCGKQKFCISYAVTQRPRNEVGKQIAGCFANNLPLPVTCSNESSLLGVVNELHDHRKTAKLYQNLPLSEIVKQWRQDMRLTSKDNLLNVSIISTSLFQKVHLQFDHTDTRTLPRPLNDSPFDLAMEYDSFNDQKDFRLVGRGDAFPKWYLEQITNDFVNCLDESISFPNRAMGDSEWISRQAPPIADSNITTCDTNIAQHFENIVAQFSEHIAVECDQQKITYCELNQKSNHLAQILSSLIKTSVAKHSVIAILASVSIESVIATLSIVRCGCIYLPLNVEDAPDRLLAMLSDANCKLLLVDRNSRVQPAVLHALQKNACDVKMITNLLDQKTNTNRKTTSKYHEPNDPTYIMYTSGSTGSPKGVLVPMRAINRLVLNTNYIDIQQTDRIALASNPAFDSATFELWGSLLNGARLVILPKCKLIDAQQLKVFLADNKISILFLTMALFHQHARLSECIFSTVRLVVLGGSVLNPTMVNRVMRSNLQRPDHILHMYGPTENTTFTTYYDITKPVPENRSIPIGKPITGTSCLVLDESGAPLPPGIPGELYIGGPGLALGYYNNDQATVERFTKPDKKLLLQKNYPNLLYKSGDLARWLNDGNIEFISRIDRQIKIRGYRIEPGEIESALVRHSKVVNAVILSKKNQNNHADLYAFIVPDQDTNTASLTTEQLVDYLSAILPKYMIPRKFYLVDTIPLNLNGKVDQKSLLAITKTALKNQQSVSDEQCSLSETEQTLRSVFCKTLDVAVVDVDSSFFDMGGHSLLVTTLIANIKVTFRVEIMMYEVFECSTIKLLAQLIESRSPTELPIFNTQNQSMPKKLPISQIQYAHWLLNKQGQFFNSFHIVRFTKKPIPQILEQAINYVIKRHEAFWLQIGRVRPVQYRSKPHSITLKVTALPSKQNADDQQDPLQLFVHSRVAGKFKNQTPMAQFDLVHVEENNYLSICMPHILTDGFSLNLLTQEISQVYYQITQKMKPHLQPVACTVNQYLDWEQQCMNPKYIRRACEHYEKTLHGDATFLLPRKIFSKTISGATTTLSADLIPKLQAIASATNLSIETLMTFCAMLTVHTVSGKKMVRCLSTDANRDFEQANSLVFMLANGIFNQNTLNLNDTVKQAVQCFGKTHLRMKYCSKLPPVIISAMSRLLFVRHRLTHYQASNFVAMFINRLFTKKDVTMLSYQCDFFISSISYSFSRFINNIFFRKSVRTTGCMINILNSLNEPAKSANQLEPLVRPVYCVVPTPELIPGSPLLNMLRAGETIEIQFQAYYKPRCTQNFLNIFKTIITEVAHNPNKKLHHIMQIVSPMGEGFR